MKFKLTNHVIQRFKKRTGCKDTNKAIKSIYRLLARCEKVKAYQVSGCDKIRLTDLVDHDMYTFGQWRFVVRSGFLVVTCFEHKKKMEKKHKPIKKKIHGVAVRQEDEDELLNYST